MSQKLSIYFLFALCTLIWGFTWYAIKLQLPYTDSTVAVFWRFLASSFIIFTICFYKKINLIFPKKIHIHFLIQGLCLYSLNYFFSYTATQYTLSAVVSLAYTFLIFFNVIGAKYFLKSSTEKNVLIGGSIAIVGMFCIAISQYINSSTSYPNSLFGFFISLTGVFFASIGNITVAKNRLMKIPILANNAWSMLYGTVFTLFYCLLVGKNFSVHIQPTFIYSFIYLTVFGTVISFWAYNKIIDVLGPSKAAFTSVLSPIIAILVSTLIENLELHYLFVVGATLSLMGNLWALTKKADSPLQPKQQ